MNTLNIDVTSDLECVGGQFLISFITWVFFMIQFMPFFLFYFNFYKYKPGKNEIIKKKLNEWKYSWAPKYINLRGTMQGAKVPFS